MNTLRFGILSFAHYHANFWSEAFQESPDADLVGIWDDDHVRGQTAARRYDVPFEPDLDALLSRCDAVGITSETSKHADLVERAAAAGVHVILEKPMATNSAECERIYQAVTQAGITFMQNFPKRYDPVNAELVRKVQAGELGTISMARVRHGNYHLLELGAQAKDAWYAQPEFSGGGALIDEGVHAIDFLLWLFGEPDTVYARTANHMLNLAIEDTALVTLTFPSGTVAEIATSNVFVAAEESVEVYGDKGTALLSGVDLASRDFARQPFLKFYTDDDKRGTWQHSETIPFFRQENFHQQGPLQFIDCIKNGKEPVVSVTDGRKSLIIVEAAYRAARTGQAQDLSF